jgi:hypothetical protein
MYAQSILVTYLYILICLPYVSAYVLDVAKDNKQFEHGETNSKTTNLRILKGMTTASDKIPDNVCLDLKPCENTDGTKPTKVPCDCKDQRVPANKNCLIEDIVLEKCRGGT